MEDYSKEQWYIDLQKAMTGFTEDYLKQISDGKLRQLEGASNGGNLSGLLTQKNKTGIHTEDEELRRKWAVLGGEASIEQLLQWQNENGHNIGEIAKVKDDEWINKISKSLTGRKIPKSVIDKVRNTLKAKISAMTPKERSEKYSNDASSRKSLSIRKEVLKLIENDTFTTAEARNACEEYGLGNWKGFLKDKRIIKQIHKGTNNYNPSIYKKI